eukprot:6182698-Pleurochrysis_carterae.AAC.1
MESAREDVRNRRKWGCEDGKVALAANTGSRRKKSREGEERKGGRNEEKRDGMGGIEVRKGRSAVGQGRGEGVAIGRLRRARKAENASEYRRHKEASRRASEIRRCIF